MHSHLLNVSTFCHVIVYCCQDSLLESVKQEKIIKHLSVMEDNLLEHTKY